MFFGVLFDMLLIGVLMKGKCNVCTTVKGLHLIAINSDSTAAPSVVKICQQINRDRLYSFFFKMEQSTLNFMLR